MAGRCIGIVGERKYFLCYEKVSKERRKKANRIVAQEGKALSVGAWILLQKMREEYGLSDGAVYNFSHSGKYVLCSVDDSESEDVQVGCDIEEMKQSRLDVARHFFCTSEIRYIESQETEEAQREAFYRYWVLKESFMKATRKGMKLGLNEFEIRMEEEPYLIKKPDEYTREYYYREYEDENIPYKMAVCSTCNEFSEEICKIIL